MIKIFTDGGARGNPGPAAIGVFICDEKEKKLAAIGKTIGIATNNVAEYKAVIEALMWLVKNPPNQKEAVHFFLDSELVCRQVNGLYKVKNSVLRELLFQIRVLEEKIHFSITYSHIRREHNKKADLLVNQALDKELS